MDRGGPLATIQNITTNQNVPGGAAGGMGFEGLLNMLRNAGKNVAPVAKKVGGKSGLIGAGIGLATGDYGGAAGSLLGGALGSIAGPIGTFAGATIGGLAGSGIQSAIAGGIQGGQDRQRERGESATMTGLGSGKGIGFSQEDLNMLNQLSGSQREQALQYLQQSSAILEGRLDNQSQRYMQQVQQQAQLTGALNRQQYMAQLAGGAQAQSGATNRTVLTASNPYVGKIFG